MFALPGYDAFLGFLLIAAAVPALALITNKLVAPKSRAGERQLTYESGMEPIGGAWIQFNIRYYMFALVFVIFDVETVSSTPGLWRSIALVCWLLSKPWSLSPSWWWRSPMPGAKAPWSGAESLCQTPRLIPCATCAQPVVGPLYLLRSPVISLRTSS